MVWGWGPLRAVSLRLITAIYSVKFSPQNSIVESHNWRLVRRKGLTAALSNLMPSGFHLFIQFLRTRRPNGPTLIFAKRSLKLVASSDL